MIKQFRHTATAIGALAVASPLMASPAWAAAAQQGGPGDPDVTNAAASQPGAAQQQPMPVSNGGLADIVVTARKVAENMQDVPVSITAFSGKDLEAQSATQLQDVAKLTPGLIIRPSAAGSAQAVFQIRGQFQNDTVATLDPSVGVYVDDLYVARAYGINSDLVDVVGVQTLRGPQGTLFGRNTTGGAILIQTGDPELDAFTLTASGTYGRFDERSGSFVVNIPIVPGRVAARGALKVAKRDGYMHDLISGRDAADQDSVTGRAKLLVQATDNLSLILSGEIFRSDFAFNPFNLAYVSPTSAANLSVGFERYGPGAVGTRFGQGAAAIASDISANSGTDTFANSLFPRNKVKTQTYAGTLQLDTFFGAVKFIGGYRKVNSLAVDDIDGSRYVIVDSVLRADLEQYSGELQVTGQTANDAIDFAAGLFYFEESGTDGSTTYALAGVNPNNPNITFGHVSTRSQGMYAQAAWHVTDALSLTGGLRYSVEDKGITLFNRSYSAATGGFVCSLPSTRADCGASRSDDFSGLSYTAGIDYELTPDILLYAKAGRGFRSGGQNLRSAGTLSSFVPFKPEIVNSYEAGIKAEFFDRKARVNLAGYYSAIKDIQRSTIVTASSGQTATIVGNAGKARIFGGEAEVTFMPVRAIELAGTLAYTNPKYLDYVDPNTGLDRSDEPFDNIARWTFSTSATFRHDFDFGAFSLRGDFAYQGRTALQPYGGTNPDIRDLTTMDPVGLLGARAMLTIMDGALDLAAFGRNLTNNRSANVAIYLPPPIDLVALQRREPRTFGVSATYRYGN